LAESLVAVAEGAGLPTLALLTDMDRVLGHDVGNALEEREAIDFLTGRRREPRLHAATAALAQELLVLAAVAAAPGRAGALVERAFAWGAAADRFARRLAALGGPYDLAERPESSLPQAPVRLPVFPDRAGLVIRVDARMVGLAVAGLGGGRQHAEDEV